MTQEEALAWIADVLEETEALAPETPRDAVVGWDSLGVLTLMASLDQDFDIVLTDEDLQEMKTVGDILETMRQHGKLD